MKRLCPSFVLAAALLAASPVMAAGTCKPLAPADVPNCTKVQVSEIAKAYLDLYKIDGGKAVLDRSLKSDEICLPFQATDCNNPTYYMIETDAKEKLLFRKSDLRQQASAGDCVCPRSAQNTVIGAPGAGKLKECAPEMCQ